MNVDSIKAEIESGFARVLDTDKLPSEVSTKQASKLLGVSEGTLAVWRCTKRYNLPYYKIGSNVRYPLFGITNFKIENLKEVSHAE